jgi:hypothetical protein
MLLRTICSAAILVLVAPECGVRPLLHGFTSCNEVKALPGFEVVSADSNDNTKPAEIEKVILAGAGGGPKKGGANGYLARISNGAPHYRVYGEHALLHPINLSNESCNKVLVVIYRAIGRRPLR